MNRNVLRVSLAFSKKLVGQGAEAVVLFGSWVRGDAYEESDIDIQALGRKRYCGLERYKNFLISVSWMTARQHRQAFADPSKAGGIIPAWRNARIIYDPKGIAQNLKKQADMWRWKPLEKQADSWVAEEVTGWAEEVHRLIGNLQLGRKTAAAVQRSVLAIKMAPILAVHNRILYDTENQLWTLVTARMGERWAQLQSLALGEMNQSFEETCEAGLQLYAMAAQEVRHILDRRQYEVVAHACKIAGHPMRD